MASNTHSLELTAANTEYAYRENADCTDLGESGGSSPSLFSAWIKPTSSAHMIIAAHTTGFDDTTDMPDGGFEFSIVSDGAGGYFPHVVVYQFRTSPPNFGGLTFTDNTTGRALDAWHHVAVYLYETDSGNTTNARFYFDGQYTQTISKGNWANIGGPYSQVNSAKFTVGVVFGEDTNPYGYWNGQIDELFVDRPGSTSAADAAIASYYRSCAAPGTSHWRFDNDLTDDTANANDLTGVNTPTYSTAAFSCFIPKMCQIL